MKRKHAIWLVVLTSIYLCVELAFNARLLDVVGSAPDADTVHHIEIFGRSLSGVAVALDDAYVPVGRFEEIDARRLRQYGNSLYTLLERRDGVRVRLGAIQARATLPDRETMTLLGLTDVEPLLMITRLGQALTGEAVEWRERLCRSARWAFQREP